MSTVLDWKTQLQLVYKGYPQKFWILMGASFVDSLGGAVLYPFYALYVTSKFNLSMSEAGGLFGVMMVTAIVGTTLGGGLTDRFGRKSIVLFGLIFSAISMLVMGFAQDLSVFILGMLMVGLLANAGGPAREAMVADLLPEEKRAGGFGVHRVVHNLAYAIGPALGGLLASRSYLLLFIMDVIASLITAFAVYKLLPETKPESAVDEPVETTAETFRGYRKVLQHSIFMAFLLATSLMVLVATQMQGTLSVFLRDVHGLTEARFGTILSLNAAMVVLFQFAITRRIERFPHFIVLAVGTTLYAIGFSIYGFVSTYVWFLVAMVIITIGEMFIAPIGSAVASNMAPEQMRGRYMAVFGFSWMIPGALGMFLAGLIIDYGDPRWVWYAAGIVGLIAAAAYYVLHLFEIRSGAVQRAKTYEVPETVITDMST
jgi:MFS family permease